MATIDDNKNDDDMINVFLLLLFPYQLILIVRVNSTKPTIVYFLNNMFVKDLSNINCMYQNIWSVGKTGYFNISNIHKKYLEK